jgi:hypothetical protein
MSYNEEFWWEEIDNFFVNFAFDSGLGEENYLGKVFLITIDKDDLDVENSGSLRISNNATFDNIKKFEPWIGQDEVKEWENTYKEISNEDKSMNLELLLYSNDWDYICSLTISKEQMEERL